MPGGGSLGGGIGSLIGGIGVLSGMAGKGGKQDFANARDVWLKLAQANFDMTKLTPAEQQVVATMQAEQYNPQVEGSLALGEDSPQARQAQVQALQQMQGVAAEGLPQADQLASQDAQRQMGMAHQRYTQAALNQLQAQGRLGGGADIAARLGAGQQAAELGRGMGSDITRDSMMRRLQAMQQSGQFASGLRGQDQAFSQQQAQERNMYNQWLSGLRTNVAAQNAGARERAQGYNVQNQQGIANTNVANRYANALGNINRPNDLRQKAYENALAKASGLAGAYQAYGVAKYNEQAGKERAIKDTSSGAGQAVGGLLGGII